MLLLSLAVVVVFVVTALVLADAGEDKVLGDAQDEEKPEEVDGLQAREEPKGDVLADPALVLLGCPVEFEGSDRAEFGQCRPEDAEVDEVAEVDPDADEQGEVGPDEDGVEVVEGFGGLGGVSFWSTYRTNRGLPRGRNR